MPKIVIEAFENVLNYGNLHFLNIDQKAYQRQHYSAMHNASLERNSPM